MRRLLVLVFIFFLSTHTTFASDNSNATLLKDLQVGVTILATENESLHIEEILDAEWQNKFQAPSHFNRTSPFSWYWLKVDFKGHDLSQAKQWTLFAGYYDEIIFYYKDQHSIGSHKIGSLFPYDIDEYTTFRFPFSTDELFQERHLYVRIKNVRQPIPLPQNNLLYSSLEASTNLNTGFSTKDIIIAIPTFLFVGGVLAMMLYSFGVFFLFRDKVFLYYSFYLLTLVLYLGRKTMTLDFLYAYPQTNYIFNEVIQVVVNIAYLTFILNFINAKQDYPLLNKVSRYIIGSLILFIVIEIGILSNNVFSPIQYYLISFERYFMSIFALAGILYIFFTLKNKVHLFIIIGSVFFIGGALLSLFMDARMMMTGAMVEVFIFALGIGYRLQQIQKEKQKIKKEIDKVRLTALKAQMNPHFIFNSLNSIRSYIIVNETKKASSYLTKFAKLIRLILEYASSDYITLREEIAALELYVELEQMRFRDCFDFTITVDPKLDLDKVQIPPLIFQPYIENAIWHGLTPKSGEKAISLTLQIEGNEVLCIIKDNGVGRNQAAQLRPADSDKKSMALSLTLDRINLINPNSSKTYVSINDLISDGQAAGTEVKLVLPLIITAA